MNKKKSSGISFFIIFTVLFVLVDQARAELITLIFSSGFPKSHIMQQKVFEPWAKNLNKFTKGQCGIKFFSNGFMGPASGQYSLVENGIADISFSFHDFTPDRFPVTSVYDLPFVVPNAEMASRSMWQSYENYPDFHKEYDKVKLLALFCYPAAHFHTIAKPINTISDLKGMKIITTNPYASDALRILGAVPVSVQLNESYSALEKGSADGILLHWEALVYYKLDNFIKYTTRAYFSSATMMVCMSKVKYKSLPKDIKRAIDKTTGMELSKLAGQTFDSSEDYYLQIALKKGIKLNSFSKSELKKLQSLTIPLREQWSRKIKKEGLSGDKILKDVILLESITIMHSKI